MFRRLTRFPASPALDPRENRLTEVTASVLERVEDLARDVVIHLLATGLEQAKERMSPSSSASRPDAQRELERRERLLAAAESIGKPRTRIHTQLTTRSRRFVDLSIHLRPTADDGGPDVVVWVEVKHGADLHGDQLDAYLEDIRETDAAQQAVVVLAPRAQMPTGVPPNVLTADWQGIARLISDRSSHPSSHGWLLTEYASFLKEEGLMDPDALTATHAIALLEHDAAAAAVAAICGRADEELQRIWGKRGSHLPDRSAARSPAYGLGYWANYPAHREGDIKAPGWDQGWFEWGLRDTAGMQFLDESRGSFAFMAGATLNTPELRKSAAEAWFARRRSEGFQWLWHSGRYRLVRLRYPDELLSGTSIDTQGRALAEWIHEAFQTLADDPPESAASPRAENAR
jgi:hypothetical protein